jgi:hypothetical protein
LGVASSRPALFCQPAVVGETCETSFGLGVVKRAVLMLGGVNGAGLELEKLVIPLIGAAGRCPSVIFLVALGVGGVNGAVTNTTAVSVDVTFGPLGGVPVSVATFVKLAVTFGDAQV